MRKRDVLFSEECDRRKMIIEAIKAEMPIASVIEIAVEAIFAAEADVVE